MNGKVRQFDTPRAVYERPADTFVAQFIGTPSMNLYDGTLTYKSEHLEFQSEAMRIPLHKKPLEAVDRRHLGKPVILGIRPEHIHVRGYEPQGMKASVEVPARVRLTELLGHEIHLTAEIGANSTVATVDSAFQGRSREEISLIFDSNKIHLFDKDTELALA